jgi:hypothetical protein
MFVLLAITDCHLRPKGNTKSLLCEEAVVAVVAIAARFRALDQGL